MILPAIMNSIATVWRVFSHETGMELMCGAM